MKIAGKADLLGIRSSRALNTSQAPDYLQNASSLKPPRRKASLGGFAGAGVRLRKGGAPAGRRSRPETPLCRWKFGDEAKGVPAADDQLPPEVGRKCDRGARIGREAVVPARKLAAGLWRLRLREAATGEGEMHRKQDNDRLGFQHGASRVNKPYDSEANHLIQRPHPDCRQRNGYLRKLDPSVSFFDSAMEGATKWDPVDLKTSEAVKWVYGQSKSLEEQVGVLSMISMLKQELYQSQARVHELETERRSSKKKLEHFLKKLSEERAAWRSREHEKIRAVVDDIKADLKQERKNRQKMEIVNSKLVNELADAKQAAKRFMQEYEKERKARVLIEEVCEELAKEVGEDKAEFEALKRESMKLQEEVEDERKMLQMAEVWREERVQMKLVDAKVTLEEKHSQMNKLIADLETFLSTKSATSDLEEIRKVEFLRQAAASVNIHNVKGFTYDPPNSDDIFSILEDIGFTEHEREIEPCVALNTASHATELHTVSHNAEIINKNSTRRSSDEFVDQNGDIEEEGSGWETVSNPEDHGSNYSSDGSDQCVNDNRRDGNVSGSGTEWEQNAGEETRITEIPEVCSVPKAQLKKGSSISRLWRSSSQNGEAYKIISAEGMNGRLSTGGILSPDRCSSKGGRSPSGLVGQWNSTDSSNPHVTRGVKGCIEWPMGTQKNGLKDKLSAARMNGQKIQLRHVLKQKI